MTFLILLLAAAAGVQTPSVDVRNRVTSFQLAGVEERRSIMRQAQSLAQSEDAALPLIIVGLQDADAQTRFEASACLAQVLLASRSSGSRQRSRAKVQPGTTSGKLIEQLYETIHDPDYRVRGVAVQGLGFLSSMDSRARGVLSGLFYVESADSVRALILNEFANASVTREEAQPLVALALNDRTTSLRIAGAIAVMRLRLKKMMPLLVSELQSGNAETVAIFARALSSFGADAASYLPMLDSLLNSGTDPTARASLRAAIDTIRR